MWHRTPIPDLRRRWVRGILIAAALLAVLTAAVPIVAFVIVPQFVRSTVHEALPAAPTPTAAPSLSAAATPTPAPPQPRVLLTGRLRRIDAAHFGSGTVNVIQLGEQSYLRFEAVDIAGAPNMFVYLSHNGDGQPGTFTDLGPLKATNGSFNYEIPSSLDLAPVRTVVVWCRAFSVTVTWAALS